MKKFAKWPKGEDDESKAKGYECDEEIIHKCVSKLHLISN